MKIMVFDVPASTSGALTILNEYYNKAVQDKDKNKKWIFVISTPNLKEKDNIKILKFPWIKNSWFHRLYFDTFIAPKLVKEHNVDEILSLQNLAIKIDGVPQTLYMHQPLPFVEKRYKITENLKFWIYQNIIGKNILKSLQKVDKVIVQTEWLKKECSKRANINDEKITVIPPNANIEVKQYFSYSKENIKTFFYPATAMPYKNHEVIVKAVMMLKERMVDNFKVFFTLVGNETKDIKKLYGLVKLYNLPIEFIGAIPYDEVLNYYSHSILLFPSYIETYGLPLAEAKQHKTVILASDCPFSKEILKDYDDSRLLEPNDPEIWAKYIGMMATHAL